MPGEQRPDQSGTSRADETQGCPSFFLDPNPPCGQSYVERKRSDTLHTMSREGGGAPAPPPLAPPVGGRFTRQVFFQADQPFNASPFTPLLALWLVQDVLRRVKTLL